VEPLVQYLPWDFKTTFPQPTQEALDAGTFPEEDATPEGIRSVHDEHARQTLATLHDLDAFLDARHHGVDPATGKPPRTAASRQRLQERFKTEPARLEHAVEVLMDVYETVFGPDAASAFIKAIRAWHAGIKVEVEAAPKTLSPLPSAARAIQFINHATADTPPSGPRDAGLNPSVSARRGRVVARLPVPRPLHAAISAGHFGQDESSRHIRPGAHEVREITECHAEKLIGILDSIQQARGSCVPGEANRLQGLFDAGLAAYAEDFGQHAADQLEAYTRRQASLDSGCRRER
jgi:hypothetical protein